MNPNIFFFHHHRWCCCRCLHCVFFVFSHSLGCHYTLLSNDIVVVVFFQILKCMRGVVFFPLTFAFLLFLVLLTRSHKYSAEFVCRWFFFSLFQTLLLARSLIHSLTSLPSPLQCTATIHIFFQCQVLFVHSLIKFTQPFINPHKKNWWFFFSRGIRDFFLAVCVVWLWYICVCVRARTGCGRQQKISVS